MAHVRWVEEHDLYERVHIELDNPYTQVVPSPYGDKQLASRYVAVFSGHVSNRRNGLCETAPYLTDEYGDILCSGDPVATYYGLVVGKAIRNMGEELE